MASSAPGGIRAKAASVGAKTVRQRGPGELHALTTPTAEGYIFQERFSSAEAPRLY
jgi:hypothetical protein